MKAAGIFLLGSVVAMSFWVSQVRALPPFKKAFEEKYAAIIKNPAFNNTFKVSCNVCHVKGEQKTVRSDYGKALAKITGGKVKIGLDAAKADGPAAYDAELAKVLKTLDDAFGKVESEKSPTGETFGQRMQAGKLP